MTRMERAQVARRPAPEGMRWANGGGSVIGECNGYHLARLYELNGKYEPAGTICGRYGPNTPPDPPMSERICGNCARIAKVPRTGGEERR